jgi:2',3'-cyclic-nucleotide 2'-phosphodiesterase/3'-nucleotidase
MLSRTLLTLTLAVAATTAWPAPAAPEADLPPQPHQQRLTILHTSDLHGALLPHDDLRAQPRDGSLAQVATLVRQIREQVAHQVLLLDSGDTIQGTPLEHFVTVRWGRPSPTLTAMNRIGYQAMAVGNHEFNFGLQVLRRAERTAAFPLLAANIVEENGGGPAFTPFRVLAIDGLRIGVLGLTTPHVPSWEVPEHYRGLRFEAMDEAARRWVKVLRSEQHCDLVVVLAHTGFEVHPVTGEAKGTELEDFAWRLAHVPGIDVLLAGHSHQAIAPLELAGTVVSQPRSSARILTRIDLDLERGGDGWRVAGWQGENLPTAAVAADPAIVADFAAARQEVLTALSATLTHTSEPIGVSRCRLEDCAALDLIHAVQLEATGAELSLAAILSDRTPDLPAGPLDWHWVHALYVYPNTPVVVQVSGQQVKDILEHAARFYAGLDCPTEGPCTLLTDPKILHFNVDTMAGVSYRIDPTRPEGDRIRDLRRDGRPLHLHGQFTLACNNFRAAGGGDYPHLAEAERVWTSATEMTELIGAYLERFEEWHPSIDSNWWIGPDLRGEKPLSGRP